MFGKLDRTLRDESGLSALETAIVLIAFVVVASVFAFTMLSAGMFSTERSKEAVYAGLEEVRGSMELRGSIVVTATAAGGNVDAIIFTVSNVAGGDAIDLTPNTTADDDGHKVVIDYRDSSQVKSGLVWSVDWLVSADEDYILEEGELAQITIAGLVHRWRKQRTRHDNWARIRSSRSRSSHPRAGC